MASTISATVSSASSCVKTTPGFCRRWVLGESVCVCTRNHIIRGRGHKFGRWEILWQMRSLGQAKDPIVTTTVCLKEIWIEFPALLNFRPVTLGHPCPLKPPFCVSWAGTSFTGFLWVWGACMVSGCSKMLFTQSWETTASPSLSSRTWNHAGIAGSGRSVGKLSRAIDRQMMLFLPIQ